MTHEMRGLVPIRTIVDETRQYVEDGHGGWIPRPPDGPTAPATIDLDMARMIAGDWHGGQASALYSLASTGKLHSEDHRLHLIQEINLCQPRGRGRAREEFNLTNLLEFVLRMRVSI